MSNNTSPWLHPNIEGERAKRNWSQEEVAQKLDIAKGTYYNWVTKGRIPSDKLLEMKKLFNCSIDYLLENTLQEEQQTA